jgi:hypothetical protein
VRITAEQLRARYGELRDLVNAWDPVGLIADGAPVDEYDCLVGPVLRRLEANDSPSAIAEYLSATFDDHFGVPLQNPKRFAEQVVEWYSRRWPDTESIPLGDAR